MNIVLWFAGVLVTVGLCKFVFRLFRQLTSKENIDYAIACGKDKIATAADKVADKVKEKRKQKKEENVPVITIH